MGTVEYNAVGLFFAALFLLLMAVLWLSASRAERRRTAVAEDYVEPERPDSTSKYVWQPAAPPSPAIFGFPDENQIAQMPAMLRWIASSQVNHLHPPQRVQATVLERRTLTVFEYISTTQNGSTLRTLYGAIDLEIDAPALGVMRDVGLGTVGAGLVQFESDDFNRVYSVLCNDTRFAYSLIDGEMMLWLLAHPALGGVGIHGPHVLLHFSPDASAVGTSPDDMADFVAGFIARVPPMVYSGWGHGAQAHAAQ